MTGLSPFTVMANIFVTEFSETIIDTCINADVNDDKDFRFGQGFTGDYCKTIWGPVRNECSSCRVRPPNHLPVQFSSLPPATKLGQGYVFTRVCDSVHGWGVCLPQCMLGYHHPPARRPPPPCKADTPLARRSPTGKETPHWQGHPPGKDTPHWPPHWQGDPLPPRQGDHPWQGDPPAQCMLGDTVNKR